MAEQGPGGFWQAFGDPGAFEEVTCEGSDCLACDVLTAYGIPYTGVNGGALPNLDVKQMDAMQIIRLSLLEESANSGKILEPIITADGRVKFKEIGESSGGLSGADVYHEIQTGKYIEDCAGVMVTGGKPLAVRKPVDWKPIWGNNKEIYDTGIMYSNCAVKDFNQYCTIVFNDPHLDTSYEDGINNLYEITNANPWDEIMGYATYIDFPGWESTPEAAIKKQSTAKILLPLHEEGETPSLGNMVKRPVFHTDNLNHPDCFKDQGEKPDPKDGVYLNMPSSFRFENVRGTSVDRFLDVLDVYIIGRQLDFVKGMPKTGKAAVKDIDEVTAADIEIEVKIDRPIDEIIKLERGTHYTIANEAEGTGGTADISIVFANNSRQNDPTEFNQDDGVTNFKIAPDSTYSLSVDPTEQLEGSGVILPTSEVKGILVQEIWVSVELETPSIEVYHPDGWNKKANEIANSLEYQITPLVVTEEPAPIAFNGQLIDQSQAIVDHDPTTIQSFSDTDSERALDIMQGGGQTLNLSFLDENQVRKLSDALYKYMNSGDGTEAVYVCGPGTDVELGSVGPNGGIINSISHSYQDSNSYTISVSTGGKLEGGFAQVTGGPAPKQTENDNGAKGTVVEDMGNHIFFKVRIDGYGERIAVNMSPDIIRVGDKVQCAINNNPVEA